MLLRVAPGFLGLTAVGATAFCLGKGLAKEMLLAGVPVLPVTVLGLVMSAWAGRLALTFVGALTGAFVGALSVALVGVFLAARGSRVFWGNASGACSGAGRVSAEESAVVFEMGCKQRVG
jgi:hypothetical protein